jgi:hypothetical protein
MICLIGLGFRFATIGFGLATMTRIVTSDYPLLDVRESRRRKS